MGLLAVCAGERIISRGGVNRSRGGSYGGMGVMERRPEARDEDAIGAR